MQNTLTVDSLLSIGIGFISTGTALVVADKIIAGVIVAIIGFAVITTRGILKRYRC